MTALSRDQRLRQKKAFDAVFKSGTAVLSDDKRIKILFLVVESDLPFVKAAAAPSKKFGSAVWRNRFKRLAKEAYRKNKAPLISLAENFRKGIYIIIFPYNLNEKNNKKIFLRDVEPAISWLIGKILDRIK